MKLLIKVQTFQFKYLKVVLSKFGRYFSGINLMLLIVFFFNCKATLQIVRNKIHLCKKLIRELLNTQCPRITETCRPCSQILLTIT